MVTSSGLCEVGTQVGELFFLPSKEIGDVRFLEVFAASQRFKCPSKDRIILFIRSLGPVSTDIFKVF